MVAHRFSLKKKNVLLVLPVVLLAILQWVAFLFYPYFNVDKSIISIFLLSFYFIGFIVIVIWSSSIFEFEFEKKNMTLIYKIMSVFFAVMFIFFSYKIISSFSILNFAYIRNGYFNDESLQESLFGNWVGRTLFRYYITPLFWFFLIKMIIFTKKSFWWVMLAVVPFLIFSVLTGSRFSIYYFFIIAYFRAVINGTLSLKFILTILLIGVCLAVGGVVLKSQDPESLMSIFFQFIEYHMISPFYMIKAIEVSLLDFSATSLPFEGSLLNNPLIFLKAVGVYSGDIAFFSAGRDYNQFILYSSFTGKNYNAYAGAISVFFKDFGFVAPLFFVMLYFSLFFIIKNIDGRGKGPLYVYVLLYSFFSLYQMQLSNPGFQALVFVFVLYSFLSKISRISK